MDQSPSQEPLAGKKTKKQKKTIAAPVPQFKTEKEAAMDFAIKVHEKFDKIVKAIVLFGSQAKGHVSVGSDIDIVIIVDDAAVNWDLELISWYREELGKIIANDNFSRELHVNTVMLTTWWRDLLNGDPVVINMLRYGEALIDYGGFFNPIKALLLQGKIHSTPEAVYTALQRAPEHLSRSRAAVMGAIEGVYWTIIDSSQAALMMAGKIPPSPEHIPQLLTETFVDKGMLKGAFVNYAKEIYSLHKDISHGNIQHIKGEEIDEWQDKAQKFLLEMTNIIDSLVEANKKIN